LGEGVETLTEVQKSARVEDEVADVLVGVAGPETGEDDPSLVGAVVAVLVAEEEQVAVGRDPIGMLSPPAKRVDSSARPSPFVSSRM
jgi:hypothetical protein